MSFLDEIRGAFGKATRRRTAAEQEPSLGVDEAVEMLSPNIVALLAQFAGHTRSELDATFELLPVGTRIALDNVGAVKLLDDDGGEQYGLQALPFAVDLVNAAAQAVALSNQSHAAAAAAFAESFHTLRPANGAPDAIGAVNARGRTLRVDRANGTARIQILAEDQQELDGRALPEVDVPLALADDAVTTGVMTVLEMALYEPGASIGPPPAWDAEPTAVPEPAVPARIEGTRVEFVPAPMANAEARVESIHVAKPA